MKTNEPLREEDYRYDLGCARVWAHWGQIDGKKLAEVERAFEVLFREGRDDPNARKVLEQWKKEAKVLTEQEKEKVEKFLSNEPRPAELELMETIARMERKGMR